jgi:hypothetical protein
VANSALDVAYPVTYYPGTTDPDAARAIVLRPGDRTNVEMNVIAVPALHLEIDNIDENVTNAQAILRAKTLGGRESTIYAQANRISPDKIEITGIVPGNYQMSLQTFDAKGGKAEVARQQMLKVNADGAIDFQKTAALPRVIGEVTFEGSSTLPEQAHVSLRHRDSDEAMLAKVSAERTFEFQSVSPGWYDVTVPNVGAFSIKSVGASGARVAGLRVQLGSAPAKLSIIMSAALGSIDGVVKSEGKTIAGAMVLLVPEEPANHPQWFRRDQSDSDGTFSLGQILPGKYTLLAIRDGWELEWSQPEVLERFLPAGEVLQVQANGKLNATVQLQ